MGIGSLRPPSTKALRMRHRWGCVCVGGGGGERANPDCARTHSCFPSMVPGYLATIFHMGYGLPVILRMTVLNYRHPFMVF